MDTQEKQEIYGSFFIQDNEFAISVKFVQEVVSPPAVYTDLPLSPPYLKGLFNLRGSIIPVVDLKTIFNIDGEKSLEDHRIAIVEINGYRLGLLFDKTGEIFKSQNDERSNFEDPTGEKLIQGVFKKDEGKRIVQILNVAAVLKLQNVPQQCEANQQGNHLSLAKKRGQRKQCISMIIGPSRCALGINDIQEILKFDKVNQSVLAVDYCLGTINVRGNIVPVVDFAGFFGYKSGNYTRTSLDSDRRVVVIKIENELFGLLVDSVDSIVSYFPDELIPFPVLNNPRAEMFTGCIVVPDKAEILLLNYQKILTEKEILSITHGHAKLYQTHSAENDKKNKKGGSRKTYISFAVDDIYAVGIEDVREIIETPNTLMHPPGLPAHFKGILNLRGELITIIDARTMYQMSPRPNTQPGKVLIFKKQNGQFGLVVDSVEAIVSFAENERMKLPEIMHKSLNKGLSTDILEAVSVSNHSGDKMNLLIINLESIASRVEQSA